jgi:hypothetical protein
MSGNLEVLSGDELCLDDSSIHERQKFSLYLKSLGRLRSNSIVSIDPREQVLLRNSSMYISMLRCEMRDLLQNAC